MSRMKPYDVPHKALRNALSQLSFLAGKTDYTNPQQAEQLHNLATEVFKILKVHANDENEITLAELETRCPGCSQHDVEDHKQLEIIQDNLEALISKIFTSTKAGINLNNDGDEFYLAFSEFHGKYLEHTAEEERVTQPLLWQHFTDEELASFRKRIMANLAPATLLIWLKFIVPAQTYKERVEFISGFKNMTSESFFKDGMNVIKDVLTSNEFGDLERGLNM